MKEKYKNRKYNKHDDDTSDSDDDEGFVHGMPPGFQQIFSQMGNIPGMGSGGGGGGNPQGCPVQ